MSTLTVPSRLIDSTLGLLQAAGRRRVEGMLLWLGCRECTGVVVNQIYVPKHESGMDYFWISAAAMTELMHFLRSNRLMIAAQVHSHPAEAFHSAADDRWAIVRHEGALSLVLPDFALRTTTESFVADTAVFSLSATNCWVEALVPSRHYLIVP